MEVSEELKQLYKLLKSINESNGAEYYYLKFLVMNTETNHLYLLLKQLEKMKTKGYSLDD